MADQIQGARTTVVARRCECGFLPPLCSTHHGARSIEPDHRTRFQVSYSVVGKVIGNWVVLDRDLSSVHSKQPDCVLECQGCKGRRTLSMRYVRRAQQESRVPRCYTCKPHRVRPTAKVKKERLTYYQRRVRDQQSQAVG